MDISQPFIALGLQQGHASVYDALLREGPLPMATLARVAKLNRPAAYRIVADLEQRGLLRRVVSGKRIHFAAETPEKMETVLTDAHQASIGILEDLKEQHTRRGTAPEVTVGYGKKGIARVYDDILHTLARGDVFYRYSSASKKRTKHAYVPKDYEARRDAKRLERYVITNKRTSALKTKKLERYIRIIPAEFDRFEYDITLLVYAHKIAYIDYNSETAVTIESRAAAQFQRRLFQLLFSKLS